MMKKYLLFTLFLVLSFAFNATAMGTNIVPLPSTTPLLTGDTLKGNWHTLKIHTDRHLGKDTQYEAKLNAQPLMTYTNTNVGKHAIHIHINYCDTISSEAYRLCIGTKKRNEIHIYASEGSGVFYALQTLQQLIRNHTYYGLTSLPCQNIYDAPRFSWRGFMLDEGRHFFGKEEVKRILLIMAHYKMNRFHWHLTEDQGWRLAIEGYPRLTEVGAWRTSRTLPWGNVKADKEHYGGYYTADDIREIVSFAKRLHIEIVPEIDMPGHFQAAIASYPEWLSCDPQNKHHVWVGQGVSTDVMNVASPKALELSKAIIDQLIALFPYKYIHLGGDECPTHKWKKTPACQELLKHLGSTNYHDLQTHFYKQLSDYISSKPKSEQRELIFWNEVLSGNTSSLPHITIMAWVGADRAAQEAARRGFNTILSPQIPYYINRKQSPASDEPHTQGTGKETLRAVYAYQPAKGVPTSLLPKYLGVQANFWTEWVDNGVLAEYLLLPRLAAVAEAGWTPQIRRNYTDFLRRMRLELPFYRLHGYQYGEEAFR